MRAGLWCAVSSDVQAQEDKISIEDQETKARQLCEANGWQVVDVFRVVHSRYYIDIHDLNHDLKKAGNDALDRLMRHWSARDIDVLIVRDSTRLGRMQTLVMHMVEATIASGAKIYSILDGGMVDENNYRIWAMMGSFKAATEVDRLVVARRTAMQDRARRGLHTGPKPPMSHTAVRDPISGKVTHLELNPAYERLWIDLATLIIEGVGWASIGQVLYDRYGHAREGKPYPRSTLYRAITNPIFWGHTAYGFSSHDNRKGLDYGMWRIEPGHPLPPDVLIEYNTIEPALKGDLAEQVKQALRYKSKMYKGRRNSKTAKRFSGLFICAECGYTLRYGVYGYRCFSKYNPSQPDCDQPELKHHIAQSYVEAVLERVIKAGTPEIEQTYQNTKNTEKTKLGLVAREIEALEKKASRLIDLLSSGHEQLVEMYQTQLATINDQLRIVREEYSQLQTMLTAVQEISHAQQRAFEDLLSDGIEDFWQRDETHINRVLHGMIKGNRFAVRDGQVIGIAINPPTYRQQKKRHR